MKDSTLSIGHLKIKNPDAYGFYNQKKKDQ